MLKARYPNRWTTTESCWLWALINYIKYLIKTIRDPKLTNIRFILLFSSKECQEITLNFLSLNSTNNLYFDFRVENTHNFRNIHDQCCYTHGWVEQSMVDRMGYVRER